MKGVCASLTPAQLEALIQARAITSAVPGGATTGRDDTFGYGLVDALLAVQEAQRVCGQPVPAGVEITPPRVDLASGPGPATVTLSKRGDAPLTVALVPPAAPWLSATLSTPTGGGFGTYTISVNRTGLAGGSYAGVVRFTRSDGLSDVEVPVSMRVGADAAGPGDAGYLYVLLIDSGGIPRAQIQGSGSGGGLYPFTFTGVPAGDYLVVAGTDSDDDGAICDDGEVCGAWPTLGLPTPVHVQGNTPGLDFGVGIDIAIGGLSTGAGARPGFALPERAKVVGRAP
jgi:serine protease